MGIGLIILSISVLLIFFGLSKMALFRLNIDSWVMLLAIAVFIIGDLLLPMKFGNFSISYGGFVLPIIFILLMSFTFSSFSEWAVSMLSVLSIGATYLTINMLMPYNAGGLMVAKLLISGGAMGLVAYLFNHRSLYMVYACLLGGILGEVAVYLVTMFALGKNQLSLGVNGTFDILVTAVFVSLLAKEIVEGIKMLSRHKLKPEYNMETGEDNELPKRLMPVSKDEEPFVYKDYFD